MVVKAPSFLCANCGTKTPLDLKFCPKCKANFSLVVCSNCDHKGIEQEFIAGCPVCGYMSPGQEAARKKTKKQLQPLGLAFAATFFVLLMLALLWLSGYTP